MSKLIITTVGTFMIKGETSGVTNSTITIHKTNENSVLCITDTPVDKRCYDVVGF